MVDSLVGLKGSYKDINHFGCDTPMFKQEFGPILPSLSGVPGRPASPKITRPLAPTEVLARVATLLR